jgi:hypothetical protein
MKRYQTELWAELEKLQNNHFSHIDILTITGFMDDEQFKAHVERYRNKV